MGLANSAEWYTRWCEPIVWALYMKDKDEVRKAIESVHEALENDEVSPNDRSCLRYQLAYLEYQSQGLLIGKGWSRDRAKLQRFWDILSTPDTNPSSEAFRRRLYLQFRLPLDLLQNIKMDADELTSLLDSIPDEEKTIELWRYIATWAFRKNEVEILQKAYECAVLNAAGFNREWIWYRVDLMWKLTTGTATTDHFRWVVKSARILSHLASLKGDILNRAKELGLIDDALEQYIDAREKELSEAEDLRVASLLIDHTHNENIRNRARSLQQGNS